MKQIRVFAKRRPALVILSIVAASVIGMTPSQAAVGWSQDFDIGLPDSRGLKLEVEFNGDDKELVNREPRKNQSLLIHVDGESAEPVALALTGNKGCTLVNQRITATTGGATHVWIDYTYTPVNLQSGEDGAEVTERVYAGEASAPANELKIGICS